jgi:hypothetical protein
VAEHEQPVGGSTPGAQALTLEQHRAQAIELGDYSGAQYGDMAVSIAAGQFPYNGTSQAYESSRLVKGGAGTCYGFSGYSSRATAQFIHLYDLPNLAALTASMSPDVIIAVPASSNFSYDAGSHGRRFLQGLIIANSTTGPTYTAGAADTYYDVQYV